MIMMKNILYAIGGAVAALATIGAAKSIREYVLSKWETGERTDPPDGPPKFAFYCPHCDGLYLWNGSDEQMEYIMWDLNQYDAVYCPMCDESVDFDDHMIKILEDYNNGM